jgi:crossover junction endodeoxyribonuclease RuvC
VNVVMGIDPGFANTGFGVVSVNGSAMHALDAGVIEAGSEGSAEGALNHIRESLAELISGHEPDAIALERLYFGRNVRTAIGVGQARGAAMVAAAERGIPCFDYTPQAIKVAVCGHGKAEKHQVQTMVASLLGLPTPPHSDHAADALAVAICHAGHARTEAAVRAATGAPRASRGAAARDAAPAATSPGGGAP